MQPLSDMANEPTLDVNEKEKDRHFNKLPSGYIVEVGGITKENCVHVFWQIRGALQSEIASSAHIKHSSALSEPISFDTVSDTIISLVLHIHFKFTWITEHCYNLYYINGWHYYFICLAIKVSYCIPP